ncbi:hypothetical protein MKW98_031125 [Papaver atlanticum]|uniref:Uncharacterized protein n=1 Tax=Papaver atlanticum TaxID=357466 RepID=A0AAD4SWW6_9MAGN|nr:hypothetical protein MKW98_031125 [Papaver atlanticum]
MKLLVSELSQQKKESPDGEIDRPVLYMATHVYKNIPDDPLHPKHVAAKKEEVREIYERDPNSSTQKHLDSDVVSLVFGRDGKGYIRGMGGEVSKTEILTSAACREQLRIEKLKNKFLKTKLNALEEIFNAFEAGRQDSNPAQPSAAAPQQCAGILYLLINFTLYNNFGHNLVTGCVLRNLKKTAVALRRVDFSIAPNDENYEVLIDEIIDRNMELCVGDGTLGDIDPGKTIEWPKQYVNRAL